jgi:glycosyltransferase involved in cell wall biosynthesis
VARSIFFYTDSRELGGAENALLMLLASLRRDAWKPTVLIDAGPGGDRLDELVAKLGVPTLRVLRARSPDLFHAQMSSPMSAKWGLAAAVLARVPTVATVQLVPAYEPDRSSRLQLRALAAQVDRFIAVSRDIADQLSQRFRWPRDRIEVVHNAVALERFGSPPPPGLRAELTGGRELALVLTLARLTEQKGHPTLLRAAAELPEAVFAFAGDGPLRPELEHEAARLGVEDRVRFLGHREDVPDLLAASDVFALPSLYEGSSLALLEAMAAGRAVVSSSIGGTAELIEDGANGLLVPPGDVGALSSAIRRLLRDDGLRARLGARGRDRVEANFAERATADAVEGVYSEVLGDGRLTGR